MNAKARTQKAKKPGNQSESFEFIEKHLNLATTLQYVVKGGDVGAFVLTHDKNENLFRFVFGFALKPKGNTILPDQVNAVFKGIQGVAKDLLKNEEMTIHLRMEHQELDLGSHFIHVYVTYTCELEPKHNQKWSALLLSRAKAWWNYFTGEATKIHRGRVEAMLHRGFDEGFETWKKVLSKNIPYEVHPLNPEALWSNLWKRLNSSNSSPIPQKVVIEDTQIWEENVAEPISLQILIQSQSLSVNREWVYANGEFTGILAFLEQPGNWSQDTIQLRTLWQQIMRGEFGKAELFCQLSSTDTKGIDLVTLQSVAEESLRFGNNSVSPGTVRNQSQSEGLANPSNSQKASNKRQKVVTKAIPTYMGTAVLLHCPDLETLNQACRKVENHFERPVWVMQEQDFAWKTWVQTLPIAWSRLLSEPFDRRQLYYF